MSWTDDFNDSSLDAALFGTSVAGAATVVETTSLVMSGGTVAADAGLVYLKAKLDQTIEETLSHLVRATAINSGGAVTLLGVLDKSSAPVVDTSANISPLFRIVVQQAASGAIYIFYTDSTGTLQLWSGTAWSPSGGSAYAGAVNTWYTVRIIHTPTQFKVVLLDAAGTTILTQTSLINFSALQSTYANLWVFWGEQYTDSYYADTESDSFVFLNDHLAAVADSLTVGLTDAAALTVFDTVLPVSWDVLAPWSEYLLVSWDVLPVARRFELPVSWDVLSAMGTKLLMSWDVMEQDEDPITHVKTNVMTLYSDDIQLPVGSVVKT